MSCPSKNVINARHIYYTSILRKSGFDHGYDNEISLKYDDYLDTILQKHLLDRLKVAASESKKASKNQLKLGKEMLELIEMNCALSEIKKKELESFCNALDEQDEWQKKILEYTSKYEQKKSDGVKELDESSADNSRLLEYKLNKNIKKKLNLAQKLEEFSKCLLMNVDVDYLQEEQACDILFPEE